MAIEIQEPWLSFLRDVDRTLGHQVEIHCLGAFVLGVLWGLPRPTGDVDIAEIRPPTAAGELMRVAGQGSGLATKHRVYFQRVSIAEYPEGYASRLLDITPDCLHSIRLMAFEVHDLALTKLARNSPRDRADIEFLAKKGALDRRILQERFNVEMGPYVLNEARDAATLSLWASEFFGDQQG